MISCSHWGMFHTDYPFRAIGYRWNGGILEYYDEIEGDF